MSVRLAAAQHLHAAVAQIIDSRARAQGPATLKAVQCELSSESEWDDRSRTGRTCAPVYDKTAAAGDGVT